MAERRVPDSEKAAGGGVRVSEMRLGDLELVVVSTPIAESDVLGRLSPAEREVALLASAGCPSREIAERRGTSERTVANQLASIFKKLGMSSRTELARAVLGRRSS